MAGESPYVRLTVDQLASLVDRLSVRNRSLDDKSRWTWSPVINVPVSNVIPTRILPFNVYRRAMIMQNPTSISIFAGNDQSVAIGIGIFMTQTTQPIQVVYDDFGATVCREWWAFASGPGASATVLECVAPSPII